MIDRYDAIYARQSIDKKDSISIQSQIEFCEYELKGGDFKEYKDKGYSGKNTDRPQFQEMMKDIKAGRVRKVIVYKLDRISRSILDFAEMMELFEKYKVEFVSSTEKFDTSTPMGRAMLNICIVFAQLERETIQKRIADAMYSRSLKGFRSGATPYGFHLVPIKIEGVNAKMLEADEELKDAILLMFQMYAQPQNSYSDVIHYFDDNKILPDGEPLKHSTLKRILRNPTYVVADQDVYDFFKEQGTEIVNDPGDFNGVGSCYLHRKREAGQNDTTLDNFRLVLAPHRGIVPSELWLKCIKKLLSNRTFKAAKKVVRTWLAGKMRCGHCKRSLSTSKSHSGRLYFHCTLKSENKNCCKGPGTLRVEDVEVLIEKALKEKLESFEVLHKRADINLIDPKMNELKAQLKTTEAEIEQLIASLSGASPILVSYANEKIEALDLRRKTLNAQIAELSVKRTPPEQIEQLNNHIKMWDKLLMDDKRHVLDMMVDVIYVTKTQIDIKWKI